MQEHTKEFSVVRMAKVLRVSRSGYYQFIKAKPSRGYQEDKRLLSQIKQIHVGSRQIYGSRRIWAELRARGESCSRKWVCRLMKLAGIVSKMNKRFKITTRANPATVVAPNLLQQKFTASQPNQHWVAALTSISTREGWLYVAVMKTVTGNTSNPTMNKREIQTAITLANGEMVLLGGLLDNQSEEAKSGLLGWNFSKSKASMNSELLLLIQAERL
ncbi:MAG: IS3 family transposase [Candidatus Symbiodolus clandestinus]